MFFLNLNSRRFYFLSYVRLFDLHSGKRGSKDKLISKVANFCVISRILRKMYNFVIWRNPEENVPWDATQITGCYRCERCSNKMVKVNDGDGIVVYKKKGPVRLYLTDPIKTVFTEVQIHRVKPDLIIDHAPPCPAWSDFIPNTNPPC